MLFMKELKDKKYKLDYDDGDYLILFNKDNKMYAEGKSALIDVEKIIFTFNDVEDLEYKCEKLLRFEFRICDCCGRIINKGYTDDCCDFYNCEDCFIKEMDKCHGKGNWRKYEDGYDNCNELGGCYEYFDSQSEEWQDEPSYYTEWKWV